MTVLVIEHHDAPSLGVVGETLKDQQVKTHTVWACRGEAIPVGHDGYDGLILMGGAMNVTDDDRYPYYAPLMDLIRNFHKNNVPVLGICHGAQMIARTFGAEVSLAGPLEFGFHEIKPTARGLDDPVVGHMTDPHYLFQWHTDHYTLPDGAEHLASGHEYPHQCYRIGPTTYATQFHFEIDRPLVESWIRASPDLDRVAPGYAGWLPRQFDDYLNDSMDFCTGMTRRWLDLVD